MTAPDNLYCWNFQAEDDAWQRGWGGYARATNMHPLDQRERETGAIFTRSDLIPALIRQAVEAAAGQVASLDIILDHQPASSEIVADQLRKLAAAIRGGEA